MGAGTGHAHGVSAPCPSLKQIYTAQEYAVRAVQAIERLGPGWRKARFIVLDALPRVTLARDP